MPRFDWAAAAFDPKYLLLVLDWIWFSLGLSCLVLAAVFASRRTESARIERWLKTHDGVPFALWGVGVPIAIAVLKLAQVYSYQIMWDSGVTANVAWNAGHGYGLTSSALADHSYLFVHFAFTLALLSPLFRLWESIAVLAIVQGVAVGSSVLAVYLLAKERMKDPLLASAAAFLCMSHPLFKGLAGSVIDDSVFAAPLFLWSAYFWETGRKRAAVLTALLLLTTREQVPFIFFGVGLYLLISRSRRKGLGAAFLVGSPLLWIREMRVIHHARSWLTSGCFDNWGLFGGLGGSLDSIVNLGLHRPWELILALVVPPIKLMAPLQILFQAAFMPLFSGVAFAIACAAWFPHQLADAASDYHRLNAHSSAFVFGPLMWAAVVGISRLARARVGWRHGIVAYVLCVSGIGLVYSQDFYQPGLFPSSWRAAAPKALARIPRDAKVWCDEYFLPQLAMRRYVRTLPRSLPSCVFEGNLFVPDRVLLSTHWLRMAEPAARERIMGFLARRGFRVSFQERDLIVLTNPAGDANAPPQPIALP